MNPFYKRAILCAGAALCAVTGAASRGQGAGAAAMPRAEAQSGRAMWQPVGPMQVSTPRWGLVTGRVTSLAADPADGSGSTLYVGTTGGGVWKSTNAAGPADAVSFAPLTDDSGVFGDLPAALSIGAVSVQAGGRGVILAGTGDANDARDSFYGSGILRSTDGGATWTLIPSTAPEGMVKYSFAGNAVAGFAWSTTNPDVVVAAVSQSAYGALTGMAGPTSLAGIYYSQDAGATWYLATLMDGTQRVESANQTEMAGNAATAVVWNPVRQRFYAAVRYHGYYESKDGATWTRLAEQPGANLTATMCPPNAGQAGSPACPIFRGALAVQAGTGDMFALTVDGQNLDQGLWQDACGMTLGGCASATVQWGRQIGDAALEDGSGKIAAGDYNLWLAAVPRQQDTVLFAGTTDIWKCSVASGCAWRNTTNSQSCAGARVAPGQHAVEASFGAGGLMYFGNDGGLWRTTDGVDQQATACSGDDAKHFENLNGGLGSLAEVESFSEDPNDANTWLAALGALGTAAAAGSGAVWNQVLDGEGTGTAIDPVNPQDWYATSTAGVGINRCTEGAACDAAGFGSAAIGEAQVGGDAEEIPAPWLLDAVDRTQMLVGTCRVWRGAADGTGWGENSQLSGILDNEQSSTFCSGDAEIRSLAAGAIAGSSSGGERVYAGMAGVLDSGGVLAGHVFTAVVNRGAQAANTEWTDRYGSPVTNDANQAFDPGEYDISSLYVDPHDGTAQTVYATIEGYSIAQLPEPLVYRSTDAGAHWQDISSNLADAPVNGLVVDPNNANVVYVATDAGVFVTKNVGSCAVSGSVCWNVYGSGLPNAPAMALMVYNAGGTELLRVATYGRGIWEADLATAGVTDTTATATPASMEFSAEPVSTASGQQSVQVTNTGGANLSVSSVAMSGDFSERDGCQGTNVAPGGNCVVEVTFDPTQTGVRQGLLTVYANVAGGQLTVPLSGTGLAPGDLVLTPGSLSFAGTEVGSRSAAQDITIANTGGTAVTLQGETASSNFAVTGNTCGSSLAANASCTVAIAFAPASSGTLTGTLAVADGEGTQTAQLTGTGEAPASDALTPGSLGFGAQMVGTASAAQTVVLSNGGDEPLTGIAVSATGDFTVANNCGTLLQGHGSCSIAVSYAPTLIGAESGELTVTDELHSRSVGLSGTGVAPPGASARPESVNFGSYAAGTTSAAQTVTVTNNGGYPLTGLTAAATAGFTIASNGCGGMLPVGAACAIGVTFTAPASGEVSGELTISATNLAEALGVRLAGGTEDFSLAVSGSSTAVVVSGQAANFALQLEGLSGTSGTVTLSCSGAPENAVCAFGLAQDGVCPAATTASVTISAENTTTANVCIATGVAAGSGQAGAGGEEWRGGMAMLAILLPVPLMGIRRRRWGAMLTVFLAVALLIPSGCSVTASSGSSGGSGGGGSDSSGIKTPSGSYALTVTGTMASGPAHSVTARLTVE